MPQFVDRRHSPSPSHVEPYRAYRAETLGTRGSDDQSAVARDPRTRVYWQLQQSLEISPHLASSAGNGFQSFIPFHCSNRSLCIYDPHSQASDTAALARAGRTPRNGHDLPTGTLRVWLHL